MYINTYLFKCHTLIISELLTHALYEKHIHRTRVQHFYTVLFVFSFMDYSHHPVFQSNLLALLFPSLISAALLSPPALPSPPLLPFSLLFSFPSLSLFLFRVFRGNYCILVRSKLPLLVLFDDKICIYLRCTA